MIRINLIDNRIGLKEMPDNSVDSVVTDPPYGIAFMNKKWDHDVPSVDVWRECLHALVSSAMSSTCAMRSNL